MSFPQKSAFGGGKSAFEPVIPQPILTAAFAASKASAPATGIDLALCHSGHRSSDDPKISTNNLRIPGPARVPSRKTTITCKGRANCLNYKGTSVLTCTAAGFI
jgi:hypothetical protein